MKKRVSFTAVAVLAASFAFAQAKKEKVPPPPPPAPPKVTMGAVAPPSPPPAGAIKAVPPAPPVPPIKPKHDLPGHYKALLKRNPGVQNIGWSKNGVVHIRLKSGTEEVYHLDDPQEAQKLESKYGKLPAPPPPPPAAPRPPEKEN